MPDGTDICTDFDVLWQDLQRTNGAIRERTWTEQREVALNINFYDIGFDKFISGCLSAGVGGLKTTVTSRFLSIT